MFVTNSYQRMPSIVVELVECGKESVYDIRYTGERQGGYKQTHIVLRLVRQQISPTSLYVSDCLLVDSNVCRQSLGKAAASALYTESVSQSDVESPSF